MDIVASGIGCAIYVRGGAGSGQEFFYFLVTYYRVVNSKPDMMGETASMQATHLGILGYEYDGFYFGLIHINGVPTGG